MKPIFKAEDFMELEFRMSLSCITEYVNDRLASLGIDAETPEKLRRMEEQFSRAVSRFEEVTDKYCTASDKICELTKKLVNCEEELRCLRIEQEMWTKDLALQERIAYLECQIQSKNRIIAAMEAAYPEEDIGALRELRRQIDEAPTEAINHRIAAWLNNSPVLYCRKTISRETKWECWEAPDPFEEVTHIGRLVQIEEIK